MPKSPPPAPRATIPHYTAFPSAGGLVYEEGEAMPQGGRLTESEKPEMYAADGEGNWVLKTKEKTNG